ncbi:MAG: UDP-N-acetylmuramoyl-L-alanyl-D-glutamate--2,6-diaminopimelate ligase [bacterium]|nr:UDP-N-acetylmuramoyl-L-alanyl-D-glutamate--2,6-diaminopimelate ligase [bacterium]
MSLVHRIKQIIPQPILQVYHYVLAVFAMICYGFPSRKLIIIGVTGTNGKSSTVQFMAQLLEALGERVGYTTTAGFCIAGEDIENRMKMTMPGRFVLQRLLRKMVNNGCRYAIIETSSQGLAQFRHIGINYDVAVFTNLTPEHIEAHGGFEHYKKAKGKLFRHLTKRPHKTIGGKRIPKIIFVNKDDEYSDYFANFKADEVFRYSLNGKGDVAAKQINERKTGITVTLDEQKIDIPLAANFQQKNAFAALSTLYGMGFPISKLARASEQLHAIEGRFQLIENPHDIYVIVDYAYEPYALQALYESTAKFNPKRIIGVHGSAGGGRDVARRAIIGRLAAEQEDIVIVTNEDPYDENPRTIIEAVAKGAEQGGKVEGEDLFLIDDRKQAIQYAISIAKSGDAVLITGKGSEPVMAVAGGEKIAWSDITVAKKAIDAYEA